MDEVSIFFVKISQACFVSNNVVQKSRQNANTDRPTEDGNGKDDETGSLYVLDVR